MTDWYLERMFGFDFESTGVSVENDRIITGSIVDVDPNRDPKVQTSTVWFNPGIPIPAEATAVHGITDEVARQNGGNPADMLPLLVNVLASYLEKRIPLVGMNVPYDLTILDRECRRHGVPTLTQVLDPLPLGPAIDVYVLDKRVDRFRPGKRNLAALCEHYNVVLDGAHDSAHDALAAVRIAWRMARMEPKLRVPLDELHGLQISWKAQQDAGFKQYLLEKGQPADGLDGHWPLIPYTEDTDR